MEKEKFLEIYNVVKEDCKFVNNLHAVLEVDLLEKMSSVFRLCDFLLEQIDESCHETFLDCIYNGGEWEEIEDKIKFLDLEKNND